MPQLKLIFIVALLFASTVACFSQDRLITVNKDTIYCKIERIDGQYVVFTQNGDREHQKKIAYELVNDISKDYARKTGFAPAPHTPDAFTGKPNKLVNNNKGFMLGIGAGFSYRLAPVNPNMPKELQDYIRKLKSGFTIKVDADYFFGKFFGMGVKYAFSHAQNKQQDIYFTFQNGTSRIGTLADRISIHTIGLHLTARFRNRNNTFHFLPGLSAGYSAYVNNGLLADPIKITSGTFNLTAHLSMDFALSKNVFLVAGVDLATGMLNYYNVDFQGQSERVPLENNDRDNLTRIELWAGVRYYFPKAPAVKKGYYD